MIVEQYKEAEFRIVYAAFTYIQFKRITKKYYLFALVNYYYNFLNNISEFYSNFYFIRNLSNSMCVNTWVKIGTTVYNSIMKREHELPIFQLLSA